MLVPGGLLGCFCLFARSIGLARTCLASLCSLRAFACACLASICSLAAFACACLASLCSLGAFALACLVSLGAFTHTSLATSLQTFSWGCRHASHLGLACWLSVWLPVWERVWLPVRARVWLRVFRSCRQEAQCANRVDGTGLAPMLVPN